MLRLNIFQSAILAGTSLLGLLLVSMRWKRKKRVNRLKAERDQPSVKWKRVGEVSGLMLYPVKSGNGHSLQRAECASLGLVDVENPFLQLRDREFIVYDPDKRKAVSGLVNTKITLLEMKAKDETAVVLSFSDKEDFYLTVSTDESNVVNIDRWWGEVVSAVDCGDGVAHWLSQAILGRDSGMRLGHFSRPTVPTRTVDNGWSAFARVYPRLCSDYLGAYSYMASYLIITKESVEDLNKRLTVPVTEQHFRANIVVSGCEAYSEDGWDWLKIGDHVVMRGFKPCTRCVIVAIDPDTGRLDPHYEPLRTLRQYRQVTEPSERELAGKGSEPVFGLYAGLHQPGIVTVGDPVYIGTSSEF